MAKHSVRVARANGLRTAEVEVSQCRVGTQRHRNDLGALSSEGVACARIKHQIQQTASCKTWASVERSPTGGHL
eukprot:6185814-Pleurochrysis_carterae.AAC.10